MGCNKPIQAIRYSQIKADRPELEWDRGVLRRIIKKLSIL